MEVDKLTQLLSRFGIQPERFGTGETKTVEDLAQEIAEGETALVEDNGQLRRKLRVLVIDVKHKDERGKIHTLYEEKQVFKDGRERKRRLSCSLAEKLKAGESPDNDSVSRAINEELGVTDGFTIEKPKSNVSTNIKKTPSYPGLVSEYELYKFTVWLDKSVFNLDGYTEDDGRKVTYFKWKTRVNFFPFFRF